jgi:predicted Zn finger-like uncharacterized protein
LATEEVEKVIVQCPKCQIKLTIDEKTLKAKGAIFKCPTCSTAFLVFERAPALHKKMLARGKITATKGIKPEEKTEPKIKIPAKTPFDEKREKARMLAKTILSDLYHYNPAKAEESIRNSNFYSFFESELIEGLKLYENRIPPEVREKGDFFTEAVEEFIRDKKKDL